MSSVEQGWWGEPTAPIDWCEANYSVHLGVAEFWNSISSIFFILVGMHICRYAKKTPLEYKFHFLALGFALVMTGVSSTFFHVTLWWVGQKSYEISENITLILMLYMGRERSMLMMLLHCSAAIAGVLLIQELFCEVHLFLSILAVLKKYCLEAEGRPAILNLFIRTALLGTIAFMLWMIDLLACEWMMTLPVNPQLHAWWHMIGALALNEASIGILLLLFSPWEVHNVKRRLGVWSYLDDEVMKKEE